MQTVQEAFKKANKDDLIRYYLYTYPIQMNNFDDKITIGEAKKIARETLADYVDRLRTIDIKQPANGQKLFFFVYHYPKNWITEPNFALVSLEDLWQKGIQAPDYGCEFTEQAEIMGYYIADNQLTQHYLLDLLVYIMHAASFFGLKQEHLKDKIDKLKQAEKEVDDGKTMTLEEFELEDRDRFTSQEEQYLQKMMEYEKKIADSSKLTEIRQILQSQNKG